MIRVFVSSPYSHSEPFVMAERASIAGDAAAWLWREGYAAYSPIAHWHEISLRNGLPTNANAWIELNRRELAASDAVAFLHLPGWQDSAGMAMEREWAADLPQAVIEPRDGSFAVVQGRLSRDRIK
jgi:hypothetical protein